MRVELTIDGGFAYVPGLRRPKLVDDKHLTPDDAAKLRRLCATALATGSSPSDPLGSSAPDARRYRLVVETDDTRHTITVADPLGDSAIAGLIEFVQQHATSP